MAEDFSDRTQTFSDRTQTFSIETPQKLDMQQVLVQVYDALKEKGYNPISQIVGYILSEDPTYITTHNNARSLIRKIDRDELLKAMVRTYLGE
ncbi:IreB family regulatory phosphoprotein [Hominenteromicrobium sp.]|uniref:IreB family regulatory phosphoprotein n=2 Tax=Hominenteromicrobium sp. TaxID=3073581 RepID=UPI003A926A04